MERGYVILELLGHRQRAGWLSETEIAGAGFLKLEVPQPDGEPMKVEYYGPTSVYAIHPCDEERARKFALPALAAIAALPVHYVWNDPFSHENDDPFSHENDDDTGECDSIQDNEPGECAESTHDP